MTKRLEATKKKMLADPEVQAAYDALGDEFNLAHELIAARVRAGLTQAQLADKMGTTQSVIARLESGSSAAERENAAAFRKGHAFASDNQTSCGMRHLGNPAHAKRALAAAARAGSIAPARSAWKPQAHPARPAA